MTHRLILCSKSPWEPAVRREHALAQEAAAAGHQVVFVEQPTDVRRALRPAAAPGWMRGLRAGGVVRPVADGITVVARSAVLPGHRDAVAQRLQASQLRRTLGALGSADATVVCCVPWDWPAVAAAPAARRVFDMADDWGELMDGRRERFAALYADIARRADAVVVVNEDLRRHFGGRDVDVVRNGVASWMLGSPAAVPHDRRLLYVGTLSPRFDAALVRDVLMRLPGWSLDLVGLCQYPGRGTEPDAALAGLLAVPGVRHHGSLPRTEVLALIDAASVTLVPNVASASAGQDSMKLYDYAARGRPIVSTNWHPRLEETGPPHLRLADGADAFAAAVHAAAAQPDAHAADLRRWAAANTWGARWPAWAGAVLAA